MLALLIRVASQHIHSALTSVGHPVDDIPADKAPHADIRALIVADIGCVMCKICCVTLVALEA